MKSHTLLKLIFKTVSAKEIARAMSLSISTVYKWAEPRKRDSASGIRNPLDRVALIYKTTGDKRVINWTCSKANDYFIENPNAETKKTTNLSLPPTVLSVSSLNYLALWPTPLVTIESPKRNLKKFAKHGKP